MIKNISLALLTTAALLTYTNAATAQTGRFEECLSKKDLLQYHVDENDFQARMADSKGIERDNYIFTLSNKDDVAKVIKYLSEKMGPPPAEYGIETVNRLEHISLATGGGMLVFYTDDCSHNRAIQMPGAVFVAITGYVDAVAEDIGAKKVSEVFEELDIKIKTY